MYSVHVVNETLGAAALLRDSEAPSRCLVLHTISTPMSEWPGTWHWQWHFALVEPLESELGVGIQVQQNSIGCGPATMPFSNPSQAMPMQHMRN